MADLYARIVLRLIGPALALRERGLAERLEGLYKAAQGPCVSAVSDDLLRSAGFVPPKDGGDATESGAELPSGPSPLSPSAAVAAFLAEDAQKAAHDARAAVQRAEEAHSHLNAQWDVALKVLVTPLSPAVSESSNPAASSSSETPSGCCEGCSQAALATGQPVALPSEQPDRAVVSTRTTPGAWS